MHERSPCDQGLLVGERQCRTGGDRRERGTQPHGAGDAVEDHVGADACRGDHAFGAAHDLDSRPACGLASGHDRGNRRRVGHRHEARTHGRDLRGDGGGIRSARGEGDHLEATQGCVAITSSA